MATKLSKKPVSLTAPTRKGNACSVKWEVPAACKKSGAKDSVRFDGQDMLWVFDANPKTKGIKRAKGDVVSHDGTNKNSQKTDSETLPRKSFYPFKGKPKLATIEFWVRGYNLQGTGANRKRHYGPWASKSLAIKAPASPTVTLNYDSASGVASASYEASHPDGAKEVYDTKVWMTVAGVKKVDGTTYTSTAHSIGSYEVPDARNLSIGKWCKVTAAAQNRGLAGDSSKVEKSRYVCHPNPPVVTAPSLVYATAGDLSTAMVRVPISNVGLVYDGDTAIRPTNVKLQRLKNSTSATDAESAAAASGWTDVATDNGNTSGLSDTWSAAVSDSGKYTWYRAVSVRDGYETNGRPVQAQCLDVKGSSTSVGTAQITVASGADGKSIIATLSGKESDDDGYEVSWAPKANAWDSTTEPDAFKTPNSTLIVDSGIEEGTMYWLRARAYDTDASGNVVYGDYSDSVSVVPVTTPSAVALSGAGTTPRGSDLLLSWTYDTTAEQTEWRLLDSAGKTAYKGRGANCAFVVTPAMYGDASSLSYRVELTTGGGWARSELVTFAIADAPTCALTASASITAQPFGFTVASDKGDTVTAVLAAMGCSGTGLDGSVQQYEGDTVYSGTFSPEWEEENNVRTAYIELPSGLALHNGADYLLTVTATDAETGLQSAPQAAQLTVAWAHTAMQPTATVSVDSDARAVTLTVAAPSNYQTGDRFDLYRATDDGEKLIASGLPFGTAVTDRFAPFSHDGSNLRYLASTRTADGDVCVSDDIEYVLVGGSLRFDWGDRSIELPYNLDMSDNIGKFSELRSHIDGSESYWNEGWTRKATFNTDMVRFDNDADRESLRDMLHHPGSVFVRTPDGLAFAADVQPGTISRSASNGFEGVSLSAVEHELTDENRPGEADIAEPQWGGGGIDASNGVVYDETGGFPLDDWIYIGYADNVLYAMDPDGIVRDESGAEMVGWTYDGLTLFDENGDEVVVE